MTANAQGLLAVPKKLLLMLNKEQKDKLKLIVESIDDKLTKEGYIFTARHFDVVMDGMSQVLQQTPCTTPLLDKLEQLITDFEASQKSYSNMKITSVVQMLKVLQKLAAMA